MSSEPATIIAKAIAASYEGSGSKKLAQPNTWFPEAKAAASVVPGLIAAELDCLAFSLEQRSDRVPLLDERGVEKCAVLRETATHIRMRAAELRAEP